MKIRTWMTLGSVAVVSLAAAAAFEGDAFAAKKRFGRISIDPYATRVTSGAALVSTGFDGPVQVPQGGAWGSARCAS